MVLDLKNASVRYVASFLGVAVLTLPLLFVGEAASRISGCNIKPASADNFLAYCWDKNYADYEHGAYWIATEPEALDAARNADILFLGNSRMQYALSSSALSDFSTHTGLKHYLLGFASEGSRFAELLMERQNIFPKLVVVNLDNTYFFDYPSNITDVAVRIELNPISSWLEYTLKYTGQQLQRTLCKPNQPRPLTNWLCGEEDTVYRNVHNGHWETAHRANTKNNLTIRTKDTLPASWIERKRSILAEAKRFSEQMKKNGTCVVAINVPFNESSDKVAEVQAMAMDVPLILPDTSDLYTFDHSHLAPKSAQLYSTLVIAELTRYIDRCLE